MTSGLWARVTALFEDVRERPAPEREAWLRANSDDTTRAAVTGMLRAYDSDPDFDPFAAAGETIGDILAPALIGRRLGAYRLVAEIGRGGMGIVYAAQRDDDEFDRRAAIKILPAWSAAPVVERFRFERRVLAGLDHPGIAKLLDAGSTDDGMPYLVMELVDGQPIDAWCEAHADRRPRRASRWSRRCAPRSRMRISAWSSTATSRRPTSWSRPRASPSCSTSASPRCSPPTAPRRRA